MEVQQSVEKCKDNVILLFIQSSFGEVDWILPALAALNARDPHWKVVTVFADNNIASALIRNSSLYSRFKLICWKAVQLTGLESFIQHHLYDGSQIKIILKDHNRDEFFRQSLARRFPNALLVNFPHSTFIHSITKTDQLAKCEDPHGYSQHDLFVLGTENDIPHWSQHVAVEQIRIVGSPRYDSWWVKNLLDDPTLESTPEYIQAKKAEKVFFYIGQGPHPTFLSLDDFAYLVDAMLRVVSSYEDALLLIKVHPRQDPALLEQFFQHFPRITWMFSELHLIQLCSLADVVISGLSSGVLDALMVEKPVIEFWRFSKDDPDRRVDSKGELTSTFRELGLVAPANTGQELQKWLDLALSNPDSGLWKKQREVFQQEVKTTDRASLNLAELLLNEAKMREG